jgi:hypothetical protein
VYTPSVWLARFYVKIMTHGGLGMARPSPWLQMGLQYCLSVRVLGVGPHVSVLNVIVQLLGF